MIEALPRENKNTTSRTGDDFRTAIPYDAAWLGQVARRRTGWRVRDESSGKPEVSALHAAYARLLDRAAKTGWISPGGLTPLEQCSLLAAHEHLPAGLRPGWLRLEQLLDRCAYAGRGTAEEVREGLDLCAGRSGLFDEPPPPPPGRRAPRKPWPALLPRVPMGLVIVLVGAASVLLTPTVVRTVATISTSGPASTAARSGAWSHGLGGERTAVSAFSKAWSAPAAVPAWEKIEIDPVNRKEDHAERERMDLTTGVDGVFPSAKDPFTPPLNWAHRQRIYIGLSPTYECLATSPTRASALLRRATGTFVHRALIQVNLVAGRPVPIPTSTPDAVVSDYSTGSAVSLKFTRDEGDGLWVTGDVSREIRLSYELAANSDYWDAPLPATPFVPVEVPLPANVRKDAARVLERVGEIPGATYRDTVRRLQAYCSGFAVAPVTPGDRRENDFLTLALARKGVCRHRAWVFFVLANAAGVRTRLVENQIHAFCEVQLPDSSWRRIEFRLEAFEDAPGSPPPGFGSDFAGTPVPVMIQILTAAALLAGLLVLAALGGRSDQERHRMPRTAGSPLEARAMRDSRLAVGPGIQGLALAVYQEAAEFEPQMPLPLKERQRLLRKFATDTSPDVDAAALKRVHWDCLQVLRWLRQNRGDERK